MSVSPPRPKGPPLNALRAFEAAARLGGFAAAAEELCVTPGAVSQHIKALEDWTGAPLFERRSQGVALTRLGARTAEEFRAAFDALGHAQRGLRAHAGASDVSIAALPAVAQLWLSPRMPAIRAAAPDCAISITALETPPNLRREIFDISLFFAEPSGRGNQRVLAEDEIFPVCASQVAARLTSPPDLANETLLYDATWAEEWGNWAEDADHPDLELGFGPAFSLYSLAVDEAVNGAGVLMGHAPLLRRELESGALVAPFGETMRTGMALIMETATPASAAAQRVAALLEG